MNFSLKSSFRGQRLSFTLKVLLAIALASITIFSLFHTIVQNSFRENVSGVENDYVAKVLKEYESKGLKDFSYGVCGYSVNSKPIYYYMIGCGEEKVMVIGGLHGDEPKGVYACLELIEALSKDNLTEKYTFIVVPLCNPDGAQEFKRRNSNNVDLNRDFYTLSQPETSAIISLFNKHNPILLVDVHESFGSAPLIIYANNSKSLELAIFVYHERGFPAALAADVGQSANYAGKKGIFGLILEIPGLSLNYGNGTKLLLSILKSFEKFQKPVQKSLASSCSTVLKETMLNLIELPL
jgi:hypothetical protein